MLRLYLEDELRQVVTRVPGHESFSWDIGSTPIPGMPVGLTRLMGVPAAPAQSCDRSGE